MSAATDPSNPSSSSSLPHFHILCMHKRAVDAFNTAIQQYPTVASKITYELHESALSALPSSVNFDLVVSPANSYGLLDGGFDDAISRAFSPKDDYHALTRHVQVELYREYRGHLPVGCCHIVRIPDEWKGGQSFLSRLRYGNGKGWGCKWIAMVPTMRVPMLLEGAHDIVYRCTWALLADIERHNRNVSEADQVKSILMTPLGTGVGQVSYARWASQCLLAMKHFLEAGETPEVWGQMDWPRAGRVDDEIAATTNL